MIIILLCVDLLVSDIDCRLEQAKSYSSALLSQPFKSHEIWLLRKYMQILKKRLYYDVRTFAWDLTIKYVIRPAI